ncbi:hypothetical protein C8R44DRAFT_805910 [Mycena epipterygia]|nr:hypothetical protein C8R44DRAFT_805910 [Mycena epipterygia]
MPSGGKYIVPWIVAGSFRMLCRIGAEALVSIWRPVWRQTVFFFLSSSVSLRPLDAMDQKRRILVAFEDDSGSDRLQKRQRKIAVSINRTATNAELAKEIADTLQQPNVVLEISGGFELREQDAIDTIREDDIVTARIGSSSVPDKADPDLDPRSPLPDAVERFKITFVTAEHALCHARQTPKEQSEAKNGVLAFDGELINGNMTLRTLEQEAAHVLQWTSPDLMDLDDGACEHVEEAACGCTIACEIEEYGLSSTFHCRSTVDGSSCGNAKCPYSHVELAGSNMAAPPHCSICLDALAFPCPTCLARAEQAGEEPASVIFCPLVKNAGCGHLHHAHCVGPRKNTSPVSCPSGCAILKFPREAADFQTRDPHLTIVWDGDNIDQIPIPSSIRGRSPDSITALTTDEVIAMVERFLEEHQFVRSGLSLRIHFRDPVTDTVRFSQSTLVSVCPSSSHLNQAYRRFPLFSTVLPRSASQRSEPFSIDLHTTHAPIVACGCTPIKQLFPHSAPESSILLYAVKRKIGTAVTAPGSEKQRGTVSKESMYLTDDAWHPSVPQTPRGIAALLSSLYLFAHSVAQKGVAAEQKVLAVAYAIFRFPPAIRTMAALLLNKVPLPQEKAALAEVLYHALREFSSRGPAAITSRETRRFETVRILLACITSAADAPSAAIPRRPVEEISLLCALSRKRLKDPVSLDSALVERKVANLHQPGGALYRPNHSTPDSSVLPLSDDIVLQLLPSLHGLPAPSVLVLRVHNIGSAPQSFMSTLETAPRDFTAAIRRANLTDLATQMPLSLKDARIIAPRIVVDQEGFLAVFTGRGCGTTRDVNFFRPTNGGDTEVDVNDASHALLKVITARKAEDTWQVDTSGEVLAISRPPDEAIVLCLDLSESMNRRSAVKRSALPNPQEPVIDLDAETNKIVSELVANMMHSNITEIAKAHLQSQHTSCYHPWKILSNGSIQRGVDLLSRLSVLASRDLLRLSFSQEDLTEGARDPTIQATMHQLACFVFTYSNTAMKEELRIFLLQLIDNADELMIGVAPYGVPRKFIDFKTGDVLMELVHPNNAPPRVFVDSTSQQWFEQAAWPAGHSVQSNVAARQLKKAVTTWISGTELLPRFKKNSKEPFIIITLRHRAEETTWKLLPDTPIRTLYSLANRATRASYSSFMLKLCPSNIVISDAPSLTLDVTVLSNGGTVEMIRCIPHTRKTYDFEIIPMDGGPPQRLILPQDSSVLAILCYIDCCNPNIYDSRMTDIALWNGLKDYGDGMQRGTVLETDTSLEYLTRSATTISLECRAWFRLVPRSQRVRDESKHLTRLHLLKELFHVFLNRAGSFDTTVSLVLGLVTFSAEASVEQELTPIFENFRQRLNRVNAGGDTAIYEALDSARQMLTGYRPDLPNLRKRIIIVSDGEDTSSKTSAQEVCLALQRARVIVDSVQVGSWTDPVLHAISVATGGYRFSPRTSLADALSIFDLETMLYSGERPLRPAKPLVTSEVQLYSYQNLHHHPIDAITVDDFPPRAAHPLLQQPVKAAAKSARMAGGGDDRMKRVMREIKALVADPHPNIDVYFNDRDMSFLKVILEAPTDVDNCPYKGGTFLLTCDLPAGYPRDPPEVRFVTFIMHPNVSKQGKVCIAELGRLWSSDITLKEIFSLVYGTLLTPDLENPLEIQASLKYYEDDGTYALAVAEAVTKHAAKTRAQWRAELDE